MVGPRVKGRLQLQLTKLDCRQAVAVDGEADPAHLLSKEISCMQHDPLVPARQKHDIRPTSLHHVLLFAETA
eukprot:SAG22_NODE_1_length_62449_cov_158.689270_48_plen_72_part_00